MSATPNNAGAGWSGPPVEVPPAGLGQAPGAGHDERNALQALLAFACVHEQATKRRAAKNSGSFPETSLRSSEEEFRLDEVLQLVAARAISITDRDGKLAWHKNYDIPVVPDIKEVSQALAGVK